MGINFNMNMKNDYSYLFSSLNSNKNNGSNSLASLTSLLTDYSSIKTGSYGKLLKAYYAEDGNSKLKNLAEQKDSSVEVVTKEDAQKLNKVQTATDTLKESADALMETGSKSLFKQKEITTKDENGMEITGKGYDTAAIYKAVSAFAEDYNAVLDAANSADNSTVTNRVNTMNNTTLANEKSLAKIGITVGEDGKLSVNKDAFMKADMNSVKSLFNGTGSYGYQTSAQASLINFSAEREASKAATYTVNGDYNSVLNTGNLYNSYF
ncbi:MAG: hypothetical protein E7292_03215 [Lachnospiraceae bacterium]|nr:hypothetical protein [Lachnospiraceae bacterium]